MGQWGASPKVPSPCMLCPPLRPWSPAMRAVLLLAVFVFGRPSATDPGPESLPPATLLVDSDGRRIVIEPPAVALPAASPGAEATLGTPLCQVTLPRGLSVHP